MCDCPPPPPLDLFRFAPRGTPTLVFAVKGSDPQEADWNADGLVMHNQIYSNQMYHDGDDRVWEINEAEGNVFRVSQKPPRRARGTMSFLKRVGTFIFRAERELRRQRGT